MNHSSMSVLDGAGATQPDSAVGVQTIDSTDQSPPTIDAICEAMDLGKTGRLEPLQGEADSPLLGRQHHEAAALGQHLCPATIVGVEAASYRVTFGDPSQEASAISALAVDASLRVGDQVLVACANANDASAVYILGVLRQQHAVQTVRATPEGAVRVEDAAGRLLFTHDAKEQQTTVTVPEGDLILRTAKGAIELEAGRSSLQLSQEGLSLHAPKAVVDVDEATVRSGVMHGVVKRAKWVYEKVETVAKRLFERAENSYRRTDELHQTSAGRMRTLVDGKYRLRSGQTDVKSDGDVRIDGKQIHIG